MEENKQNTQAVNEQQLSIRENNNAGGLVNAGLQLNSFDKMLQFAEYVSKSPFAPKGMQDPGSILVAMQSGAELGLSYMASLQSIAVINGRPSVYGDTALALVRSSGLLEEYKEEIIKSDKPEECGVRITLKRKGFGEAVEEFTVADAKKADLWGKAGPWKQYPKRMLKFRCRGFILRDNFGDVLKGLVTSEEAWDMPKEEVVELKPDGSLISDISAGGATDDSK